MRILALETSGQQGSLALMEDGRCVADLALPDSRRNAQCLVPGIVQLLQERQLAWNQLELIAVGVGPGSFTGLRLGVSTAKTLAWALSLPILGVCSLRALAWQAPPCQSVTPAINAFRQQVFTAEFRRDEQAVQLVVAPHIEAAAAWIERMKGGRTLATGPYLLQCELHAPARVAAADCWAPQAAAIGQLARLDFLAGMRQDAFSLLPHYGRRSAAEEKRQRQGPAGRG